MGVNAEPVSVELFSADDVVGEEREKIIAAGGGHSDPNDEEEKKCFYGLAISGGGIRSAAFGLGVLQGLAAETDQYSVGILKKLDYLSTVSGGGYIGSALTWFLHLGKLDKDEKGKDDFGTEPKNFPFGRKGEGARHGSKNLVLDFIRQHACYLTPGKKLDFVSFVAVILRSIFVSLFVYLSIITFSMLLLEKRPFWFMRSVSLGQWTGFHLCLVLALLLGVALAVNSLRFSFCTFPPLFSRLKIWWPNRFPYRFLISEQCGIGFLWKGAVGLALIGSVPSVHAWLGNLMGQAATVGLPTVFGTVVGVLQSRKKGSTDPEGMGNKVLVAAATFALVYGLLLVGYSLTLQAAAFMLIVVWFPVGLLIGYCVNMNYAGLSRMYRDRLMETFLPNPKNVESGCWGPATEADKAKLRDMCKEPEKDMIKRPYHLINTNLILVDSDNHKYRGRGGDSYLLSPLFCGSNATCWRRADEYMNLPTAMAVSGAAANPNSGVSGRGATRSRLVSILMTLLNLRLGYWLPNFNYRPKDEECAENNKKGCVNVIGKKRVRSASNYLIPGLFGSIFTPDHREGALFLELSDGGHFENLGIYELIRRQLALIIVTDGGADPDFTFNDLANALERVRVDFGTKISFWDDRDAGLDGLLPKSDKGATRATFKGKFDLARRGYAIAEIDYHPLLKDSDPKKKKGLLLYLKTTLTDGLPADIYGYKAAHNKFPDEPTSDQFFDEAQFEAYRELGYQLTTDMLEDELVIAALECIGINPVTVHRGTDLR